MESGLKTVSTDDIVEKPNPNNFPPAYSNKKNRQKNVNSNNNENNPSKNTKNTLDQQYHITNSTLAANNDLQSFTSSSLKNLHSTKKENSISDRFKFKSTNVTNTNDIFPKKNVLPNNSINIYGNETKSSNVTCPLKKIAKKNDKNNMTRKKTSSSSTNNNFTIRLVPAEAVEKQNIEMEKLKNSLINYYLKRKKLEELQKLKLLKELPLFNEKDFQK